MRKIFIAIFILMLSFLSGCELLNNIQINSYKTCTIEEVITLDANKVSVKGVVRYVSFIEMIIEDETGYIYVQSSSNEFTNIKVGNTVIVKGEHIDNESGHYILSSSVSRTTGEIYEPKISDLNTSIINSMKEKEIAATYVQLSAIVKEDDYHTPYLDFNGNQLIVSNDNTLKDYMDATLTLTAWIYKLSDDKVELLIDEIIDESYPNVVGNRPKITVESEYYHFLNKDSLKDLTSYFTITDKEDGDIIVTPSMLTGEILLNQESIITATYKDTDGNTVKKSITFYIGKYKGYEETDNINIIQPNGLPTSGDVKVLVIPVAFSGYPATTEMKNTINTAFNGTNNETGWYSLNTYYYESSYGKLSITADVTDWYNVKRNQDYYAKYEDSHDYIYGSTIILEEALEHFKHTYDYSDYDSNDDGIIDSVYLIYNTPLEGNPGSYDDTFFWAYTYWDYNYEERTYQDTKALSYVFAGYDFFNEELMFADKEIAINAETIIHETGHLFGLEDYYDYNTTDYKNVGGYCVVDMMEYNIGDHNPFSKTLLGWSNPVVISEDGIYELPSFTKDGTCFIIGANGKYDSMFSEYYVIDYYTLNGLNNLEVKDYFKTNSSILGVRVSLVNGELIEEEGYYPYFKYNNSDTKYKIIQLLEKDYNGKFDISSSDDPECELNDFYRVGDSFGNGYYDNFKSSSGRSVPFVMEILEENNDSVVVKITFK